MRQMGDRVECRSNKGCPGRLDDTHIHTYTHTTYRGAELTPGNRAGATCTRVPRD